jgi:dTDP-4-dehydrorhamnose reductase
MSVTKKILIFGGSSLIGSNLVHYFYDKYRVITSYHKNAVKLPGVLSFPLDIFNRDSIERLIHIIKPDVVIYCSMINDPQTCQDSPKLADALNNAGAVATSYACEKRRIKMIYLSSCYIFSGETGKYREKDNPKPLNALGNSLMAAEYTIQKNSSSYLILRIPPIFGKTLVASKESLLEKIERSLFQKTTLGLDNVAKSSYLNPFVLGKFIQVCIETNIDNRILHFGSPEELTELEFGHIVSSRINGNKDLLIESRVDFPVDESKLQFIHSSFNFSLDTINAHKILDTEIPKVAEQVSNYYDVLRHAQKASRKSTSGITYL